MEPDLVIKGSNGDIDMLLKPFAYMSDWLALCQFAPQSITYKRELVHQIKYYEQYIRDSFSAVENLVIDVILILHRGGDKSLDRLVLSSHQKVKQILEVAQPLVVGLEGSSLEHVTIDSWAQEVSDFQVYRQRSKPSLAKVKEHIRTSMPYNGTLQYVLSNQGVRGFGWEFKSVYMIEDYLQQVSVNRHQWFIGSFKLVDPILHLIDKIDKLRNLTAMARTINKIKDYCQKSGVIEIGALHGNDLIKIAKSLPITTRFYQTAPTEYLALDKDSVLKS